MLQKGLNIACCANVADCRQFAGARRSSDRQRNACVPDLLANLQHRWLSVV